MSVAFQYPLRARPKLFDQHILARKKKQQQQRKTSVINLHLCVQCSISETAQYWKWESHLYSKNIFESWRNKTPSSHISVFFLAPYIFWKRQSMPLKRKRQRSHPKFILTLSYTCTVFFFNGQILIYLWRYLFCLFKINTPQSPFLFVARSGLVSLAAVFVASRNAPP